MHSIHQKSRIKNQPRGLNVPQNPRYSTNNRLPLIQQTVLNASNNTTSIDDLNNSHSHDAIFYDSAGAPSARSAAESDPLGIHAQYSSPRGKYIDENAKNRDRRLDKQRQMLPNERIADCSRKPIPAIGCITGIYNPDTQRAHFAGTIKCKSSACSYCALHLAAKIRQELSLALVQAGKKDIFAVMITATIRHNASQSLRQLRAALQKAWNATFSGEWYVKLCQEYMIEGKTKSWETTYGENGWHPHLHALLFMHLELVGRHLKDFETKIASRYIAALVKLGYDASIQRAITAKTAQSDIADYIAKFGREPKKRTWGADAEIALGALKRARRDGITPFELIDAALGDQSVLQRLSYATGIVDQQQLMQRAEALYKEYFYAFKRTPQIHWGKNLRKALELEQAEADYQEANSITTNLVEMVQLDPNIGWQQLLAVPDGRADLRAAIRTGDLQIVCNWLDDHGIHATIHQQRSPGIMPKAR